MFHVSGIFTKLHLSRNICLHSGIFQQIQAYSGSLHYQSKQYIPAPNLHCSNLHETFFFFIFVSKVDIQHFFHHYSFLIITITVTTTCHPCQYATHATVTIMPSTQTCYPPHPRYMHQHATHASTSATPTMLARFSR